MWTLAAPMSNLFALMAACLGFQLRQGEFRALSLLPWTVIASSIAALLK